MMIILGLILLILGFLLKVSLLWTIGIIVLVIGLVLALLGATGRAVAGRRHYW
jgi:membrane protein implicated in regulation of membrane protease activity